MGEFGGWDMPIQYKGILAEHVHTRTKASIFDICHMGEFEISGPSAEADLERLLTLTVSTIKVGQCRYGFLLNDQGGTLDDLMCYHLDDERYMLVVNAGTLDGDAAWINAHLSEGTQFVDLSDGMAKIDIQGPEARIAVEEALGQPLPELGYFRAEDFRALETNCLLSRTGYTGEWGYEIYLPSEAAPKFWEALLANERIEPCGLGARDTLRLEMGYPLYGHELDEIRTPAQTSRGMFIDTKKEFIGKENVLKDLEESDELSVALLFESKRAARAHDKVFLDDQEIGEITSGSLAPSIDKAVALAFVKSSYAEPGQILQVEIRGKLFPAEVVNLPFYKNGTARMKKKA